MLTKAEIEGTLDEIEEIIADEDMRPSEKIEAIEDLLRDLGECESEGADDEGE